jgi:hypothetical protein
MSETSVVGTGRDEEEIVAAAIAAYFRRFGKGAKWPGCSSAVEEDDGWHSVVALDQHLAWLRPTSAPARPTIPV